MSINALTQNGMSDVQAQRLRRETGQNLSAEKRGITMAVETALILARSEYALALA